KDGDGKEVSRSNVLNGKDGVSPKVTVTPGKDKDGQPGHTITIQKPDGSTEDVFIKDGKDGVKMVKMVKHQPLSKLQLRMLQVKLLELLSL
ncbi:hypothetical protein, partial [Streptococcus agalactiae]|uniref:collagen-flanked surface repeat-containing protein n=1 Tax=Streptococcus agalactiae TaxID=1311 RepID=UPI00050C31BC